MQTQWTIFTLVIATGLSLTGCTNKHGDRQDVDLLTNTPWNYEKAGFDSNDDGIFDALDPRIAGSEKDNSDNLLQGWHQKARQNQSSLYAGPFKKATALSIFRINTTR